MDLLILITYFSLCWVIIKIFKIPVNKWTITTVILGAVVILGVILSLVSYFHPASMTARSYFVSTPIVPNVRGKVIEVNVEPNKALKKGDILFKIDPTPFQAEVDRLNAELGFAKKRLAQTQRLLKAQAGNQFDVEKYQKDVSSLNAKLSKAKFDLESTVIKAPTSGFVTHLRVKPGMMAVSIPLVPMMNFINTDKTFYIGGFDQQPMQNLKAGNEAEIFFPGIPGRVFKGKVVKIIDALAEGQLSPSTSMVRVDARMPQGLIPVIIELTDDMSDYYIPMGASSTIAVYSEEFHHVSIIRRILMRMMSWKNFVKLH